MPRVDNRRARNLAWGGIAVIACGGAAFVIVNDSSGPVASADIGALFEETIDRPSDVPLPKLRDATKAWQLAGRATPSRALNQMAGGVALADLDNDGDLDLAVSHGTVDLYFWDQSAYLPPIAVSGIDDAVAVTIADIDDDLRPDLLVSREGAVDTLVWGTDWTARPAARSVTTDLAGSAPSGALLAAELSGDEQLDVVRLGRGVDNGEPDVVWVAEPTSPRTFSPVPLGTDERLSLAGEIADVDGDGLVDVWVTRDVGWDVGGDSVYSRQGEPTGPWTDIAPAIGADLAIDGMGITLADLDGNRLLDAYVSDLGDNEVLLRNETGDFVPTAGTGAARIRPPGTRDSVVSSSWTTGSIDVNLDGQLDLVVANGGFPNGSIRNKIPDTDVAVADPPSVLLGIGDGQFAEIWPELGLDWTRPSRAMTIGDVDGDGDDDLVFLAVGGSVQAFVNDTPGATFTASVVGGCDASGGVLTVSSGDATFQSLLRRHGFNSAHASQLSVGVAPGPVEATLVWPDGRSATFSERAGADERFGARWDCSPD